MTDHAQALADLNRWLTEGRITPERHAILHAKLMQEATKPQVRWWHRAIWAIAILTAALILGSILR